MNIRVKDLWMVRGAFERVSNTKLPVSQANLLVDNVERLWDANTDYKVSRQRTWERFGLNKKDDEKAIDREERVAEFNDVVAKLAEEEIILLPAVKINVLPDLQISPVDLMLMRRIGVLDAG